MDKKDLLGEEIKTTMEDETSNLFLSDKIKQNILNSRNSSPLERLNIFLNREVELPIIPVSVGLVAVLVLLIVPVKGFLKTPEIKTIDFGGSQVIVRDYKEVSRR